MVRPVGETLSSPSALPAIVGERQPVTALFYDIVGSTHLLHVYDSEEFGLLQRRIHSLAAAAIREHGGHFDNLHGDGGTAYFGLPLPSEDAAECAVAAGLDLVARCRAFTEAHLARSPGDAALRVRVGIATGMVIVSDLLDAGLPGRREVIGVVPNLAARLQSEAEPDSVIVAEATFRLTRGSFAFESLGERSLKGFGDAVRVWKPVERRRDAVRFTATRHPTTPLVGREAELGRLREAWAGARTGQGRVLSVAGEAGIGKSRLVAEFCRELSEPDADPAAGSVRIFQCLPRGNSRPLHPFIDSLHHRIRGNAAGSSSLAAGEVETFLRAGAALPSPEAAEVIAFLSGSPGASALADRPAEEVKRLALDATFDVLAAWARRRPQVIVLEDTHWADTVTRDLIGEAAARIAGLPVLVLLTTRQEGGATGGGQPGQGTTRQGTTGQGTTGQGSAGNGTAENAATLSLPRLDAEAAPRLTDALWAEAPPELAAFVHHKSDGVPLFAEELVLLLKERFPNGSSTARDWDRALRESGIDSLQDLLSARLAGLGRARRVAQVASVVGREFRADLLARLLDGDAPGLPLEDALAQLLEAGIIRRNPDDGHAGYGFRHVLLQEAAYDSLLKSERRTLHGRVADLAPHDGGPGLPDEIMAWHCAQAGRPRAAAGFSLRAAESCSARSAVREAHDLLLSAEALLAELEPDDDLDDLRLRLLATRGPVDMALFGSGSPEACRTYEEAVALCRRKGLTDRELWFPVYWGWWITSPSSEAVARSEAIVSDLETTNDPEIKLQALHCSWATQFHAGRHQDCLGSIERGLSLYDPERAVFHRTKYGGHDARVCALAERGQSQWFTGDALAAESVGQALAWAEETGHLGSICHALDVALLVNHFDRNLPEVLRLSMRMREIADTHALPNCKAKSEIFSGWAQALGGEPEQGAALFETGLDHQVRIGTEEDLPIYLDMRSATLECRERHELALQAIDEALDHANRTSNAFWLPELYRRRAVLRGRCGWSAREIRQDLRHALQLAEDQEAEALAQRIRADLEAAQAERAPSLRL
ncbi:MAG: AAA family ATPase [Microvirga sp.]